MTIGLENKHSWLPDLVEFIDGNWDIYINQVFQAFKKDFINSKPFFRGQQVNHKRLPEDGSGRPFAFWHLVQEGKVEVDRIPDLRRCERIKWPRPIIEHEADDSVLVWENIRKKKTNICLYFYEKDYLVVLGKRNNYLLLLTAYPIEYKNRKESLLKEYMDFHNK